MNYDRLAFGALAASIAVMLLSSCAPNGAAAMSQAAQQQAAIATGPIGTPDQVRMQARDGAQVLKNLAALMVGNSNANPQVVAAFTADTAQLTSGLDAIADSKTGDQFAASVFNMCDDQRRAAAPRVGQLMVGMANNIRANPPKGVPPDQVQQTAKYFETFGERMINVPTQCNQAQAQMAAAQASVQQAQAQHQANIAAAVNAAELIFAGAVVYESAVASRPVYIQQNSPAQITNYNYNTTTYVPEPSIRPMPPVTVPRAP